MQIRIKQISAVCPDADNEPSFQHWAISPQITKSEVEIPNLAFIPMMQRRRLSKFARMSFHCLHQLNISAETNIIFASRFGDLDKTDKLIDAVNQQQPLSPAQFGLSVHNAVAGQYSIHTNNQQSTNTISAGVDSFHMGLIDAIARLQQSNNDEIVFICTEGLIPEKYRPYIKEQLVEHCVAILLSKHQGRLISCNKTQDTQTQQNPLPQALQFLAWYYSDKPQAIISSQYHSWIWKND